MAKQKEKVVPMLRVHIKKKYFDENKRLHKANSIITLPADFFNDDAGNFDEKKVPRPWTILEDGDTPPVEKTPTDDRLSASQMQKKKASRRAADLARPVGMD